MIDEVSLRVGTRRSDDPGFKPQWSDAEGLRKGRLLKGGEEANSVGDGFADRNEELNTLCARMTGLSRCCLLLDLRRRCEIERGCGMRRQAFF